jgi:hypothetical protein
MALRVRKLGLPLALCGFVGTFGITLTAMIVARHQAAGHLAGRPPSSIQVQAGTSIQVQAGKAGQRTPAALDRQWLIYSDKSTCADRSGGDGVSAVRLSSSQLAWFFSDSSLGPAGPHIGLSNQSGFVHNLVVMQTIRGSRSTFVTVTGGNACTAPGLPGRALSVVSVANAGGAAKQRYWADDGLRIGSRVLRFYTRFRPGRVPFIPVGTVIADFAVRQLARDGRGPSFGAVIQPRITKLPAYTPPGGGTPIVWGADVLRQARTVYIYGWQSPDPKSLTRRCYLARVTASRLADLSAWRFYAGNGRWATGQNSAQPIAAGANLSIETGFSVINASGQYWLIEHAGGLGSPSIDAYPGPAPWGPFDAAAAIVLYRAPGIGLTGADYYQIMYEARAEPALSTKRALVISYNVNSLAVTAGCIPLSAFTNAVIQPRFIAIPRAVFGATAARTVRPAAAAADPAGYPLAASRHGPRWFDSWKYSAGCPPVRAVRDISVTRTEHRIRLRWRASGAGVRYRIYLRSPGTRYVFLRTAETASVTLPNLTHGSRCQVLIIPENIDHRKGPGASIAIRAP